MPKYFTAMNIYVGNLSYDTTENSLRELFSNYGQVSQVKIIKDRDTFQSRGFGFVEIPNATDAKRAISELNGSEFEGNELTVNEARPREERGGPRRDSRGGSGNRGGGYGDNGGRKNYGRRGY